MAIAELLRALEAEAAADADAIREAGRVDAARLIADATARRDADTAAEIEAYRIGRQAEADAAVATVARRVHAEVLTARAAALARVRAALEAALPGLLDGDAGARLRDALVAGAVAAPAARRARSGARRRGWRRCRRGSPRPGRQRCGSSPILRSRPACASSSTAAGSRSTRRLTTLLARWWPRLRVEAAPAAAPTPAGEGAA
ncbi:MAG: hypothetical protein H6708_00645 [Kofleriaceae bacterium]|nr:hypothetical protein [Kofleriaceae bacterium]